MSQPGGAGVSIVLFEDMSDAEYPIWHRSDDELQYTTEAAEARIIAPRDVLIGPTRDVLYKLGKKFTLTVRRQSFPSSTAQAKIKCEFVRVSTDGVACGGLMIIEQQMPLNYLRRAPAMTACTVRIYDRRFTRLRSRYFPDAVGWTPLTEEGLIGPILDGRAEAFWDKMCSTTLTLVYRELNEGIPTFATDPWQIELFLQLLCYISAAMFLQKHRKRPMTPAHKLPNYNRKHDPQTEHDVCRMVFAIGRVGITNIGLGALTTAMENTITAQTEDEIAAEREKLALQRRRFLTAPVIITEAEDSNLPGCEHIFDAPGEAGKIETMLETFYNGFVNPATLRNWCRMAPDNF